MNSDTSKKFGEPWANAATPSGVSCQFNDRIKAGKAAAKVVYFDEEQARWLRDIADRFSLRRTRLVRSLAAGEITLPFHRLTPAPAWEGRLSQPVHVPYDETTRRTIEANARCAGLSDPVYIRQAAIGRIKAPLAAGQEIMLLPTEEEGVLRDLIALLAFLPPTAGTNWPEAPVLRKAVVEKGLDPAGSVAFSQIASLRWRAAKAYQFGSHNVDALSHELSNILEPFLKHDDLR